ncbi:MAG: TolC family protein [Bacteroidetes bacterium]|nr:TolC family protein [Bacteroidota bacterium]
MKNDRLFLLLLFFISFGHGFVFSQAKPTFDPFTDEIKDKLPPLSTLLDSAIAHDPYVHFRNLQIVVNNSKLKSSQNLWLQNLGVQADVRYGSFDIFSTNTAEGQSPSIFATKRNETNYGLGAYIKFPLYDIFNRRNEVKLAKIETLQAKQLVEEQAKEVRQRVIMQYNDLIVKQHLLKIQVKYLETSRINMQMAEKQFVNGVISIAEFARISEIINRAETDFENSKMNFQTAYMLLEETVGMKFNIY